MLQINSYFKAKNIEETTLLGKVINQDRNKFYCKLFINNAPAISTSFFKRSKRETIRIPKYFTITEEVETLSVGDYVELYRKYKSGQEDIHKGRIIDIKDQFYIVETEKLTGLAFSILTNKEYLPPSRERDVLEKTNGLYEITGRWIES